MIRFNNFILEEIGINRFIGSSILDELKYILNHGLKGSIKIYACDARTLYLFSKKESYIHNAYTNASYILPDGRPIYWLIKLFGEQSIDHLSGPDFMNLILSDQELKKKRHMFYGGSIQATKRLKELCLFNNVNVVDVYSPPYLSIDNLEIKDVENRIKKFKPDFIWCGLGAPKQEHLINRLSWDSKVIMTGVGLAFDYYAGTVKKPPKLITILGFEWLIRYAQQPLRLIRFIRPFFFILSILFVEFFNSALRRVNRLFQY